jgi:hypothetical protein
MNDLYLHDKRSTNVPLVQSPHFHENEVMKTNFHCHRIPRLIGQMKGKLFGDGGFCFLAEPEVEGETVAEA